jgi:lysophospholipase L1-like esterase
LVTSGGGTPHTLAIVRRNESWQGVCTILGFVLGGDGELLPPPALPERKLMFIGDSVTCGELAAYQPGRDFQDRENGDARLSYGMVLARRLSAQCYLVSYGGRGIIRDWQGIRDTNNAPQFYELALPDDPTARWDPRRYVPDAIGIQLGTNDFSQGIPDQTEFVHAYVDFIRRVRQDAPNALIFIMESPMLDDDAARGPRRTVLRYYLEKIAAQIGSPRVIVAPLRHRPGVPGNTHPTGLEHEAMAGELEPVLRRALGW